MRRLAALAVLILLTAFGVLALADSPADRVLTHPDKEQKFDAATYLFTRLDKTLDDLRQLVQWTVGLTIAFATGILFSRKRGGHELINGRFESGILLVILMVIVIVYRQMLFNGMQEARHYVELIQQLRDASLSAILDHRRVLANLDELYWPRLLVVSAVLLLCWVALVDVDKWRVTRRMLRMLRALLVKMKAPLVKMKSSKKAKA